LLSVYDKTGIAELAGALHELGIELLSSGGTAKAIAAAGLPVRDVADYTGSPPMLGHRVVTLHPKVHGGLLAVRDDPEHQHDAEAHGIEMIDMLVANLYPFEETVADPNVTLEEAIEKIDIGGPAMVRAAAKNHRYVAVLVNPERYGPVLDELRRNEGCLSQRTRQSLALEAFQHTARYDAAICEFLAGRFGEG
jgi:phosphoribosylaminoimidazolecarboxamide formyltransferase/IMP cyclohydrolase